MRRKRIKRYLIILSVEVIMFLSVFIAYRVYVGRSGSVNDTGSDSNNNISDSVEDYVDENLTADNIEHDDQNLEFDGEMDEEGIISAMADAEAGDIFAPHPVESTKPENFLSSWDVEIDGVRLDNASKYNADDYMGNISFDEGEKYTDKDGIFTFRGNNFRDNACYGTTHIKESSMTALWHIQTGALTFEDAVWTGSGWTGQPLLRKWSRETRAHMNMYDWAKDKDELVEVIYACMDGYVYFLDMETGEATRDKLWLGFTFKGAGALDPRGYPILYLGAGYDSEEGYARAFIINLLDCSVLKEFGSCDPFALRDTLSYFDSSALVDVDTDTLIYPGENGVLYLIHLGTQYDERAGRLSMTFDKTVKWRYSSKRTTHEKFWPGMETSAAVYKNYLYITDNGANLLCVDLNTLTPVWVQDILDDSNSTPVLSMENDHLYLYVSTSFHLGWREGDTATIPVWKIDAETGEIIWKTEYECTSREGVSGGVQSTIAVGKKSFDDYIYVTVAMSHGDWSGDIAVLKKSDGSRA